MTGELLLQMLECRLDNVIFRLGFASSRKAARQLVRHRHVMINGHSVDIFILKNNQLEPINKITDILLVSPNDIAMINENQFYVTNDHGSKSLTGKMIEDYLQLSRSNLVFYNGNNFKIIIDDLQYANGVNISYDRNEVYIAETIGKKISIYQRDSSTNNLDLIKSLYVNSGVDNIEIDNKGNLWIGSHPKLFDFVKPILNHLLL